MNRRELLRRGAAMTGAAFGVLPYVRAAKQAPFGTGPGAFSLAPVYEVSVEYFPEHSLKNLTAEIPRIANLGVGTIYITPIFKCAGLAQYLILDYYAINPRYGTPDDLKSLVATAHHHGIRVLLDVVTSLTTEGSYIMTQHPDWLLRGDDGQVQHYFPFPTWGWALDCANPNLIRYFSDMTADYIRKFDIDGWRVDSPMNNYDPQKVTTDHNRMNLFRAVKTAVTRVKPGAVLMAEVSGPTVMWGKDDHGAPPSFDEMCEASYDYKYCGFLGGTEKSGAYVTFDGSPGQVPLRPTTLNSIVHNELTSAQVVNSIQHRPILYDRLRVNFIENHDTSRVSSVFPKAHRALFVLIASMPGVPVIHAGQEIGSTVRPDASGSTKIVVDWAAGDRDLENFYRQVVKARSTHDALTSGDIRDAWKSGDKAIAFLRSSGNSRVLVALNFASKPVRFTASIHSGEWERRQKTAYTLRDELSGASSTQRRSELDLRLQPYEYQIINIIRHMQ